MREDGKLQHLKIVKDSIKPFSFKFKASSALSIDPIGFPISLNFTCTLEILTNYSLETVRILTT